MKLALRIEQGVIAANAVISATVKMITVLAGKRRFRARLSSDPILLSRELLLPFSLRLAHFIHLFQHVGKRLFNRKLRKLRKFLMMKSCSIWRNSRNFRLIPIYQSSVTA